MLTKEKILRDMRTDEHPRIPDTHLKDSFKSITKLTPEFMDIDSMAYELEHGQSMMFEMRFAIRYDLRWAAYDGVARKEAIDRNRELASREMHRYLYDGVYTKLIDVAKVAQKNKDQEAVDMILALISELQGD